MRNRRPYKPSRSSSTHLPAARPSARVARVTRDEPRTVTVGYRRVQATKVPVTRSGANELIVAGSLFVLGGLAIHAWLNGNE